MVARHKLKVETGLTTAMPILVGYLHGAFGTINQGYKIFLATGLTPGATMPEQEEQDMVTRAFCRAEFEAMVLDGSITNATTVTCFGPLRLRGLF